MSAAGDTLREHEFIRETLDADCAMCFRAGTLLERVRSPYQLVEVYATPQWGKLLRLDACNMTSEKDEFIYHENLVHPAALAQPSPRRALVIGGGDGGSAEELLKHPSIGEVTVVELDQAVVDIAKKHFATVHRQVFDNPKLRLRIGDGFAYLRETSDRFDLIVFDLTDPAGIAAELYTRAMFAACKRALRPGGSLTLHIGSPWFHAQRFRDSLRDLEHEFAIVRVYLAYIPIYGASWGMATASDAVDPGAMSAVDADREIAARGIADLQYLNGRVLQSGFVLPEYVAAPVRARPRAAASP